MQDLLAQKLKRINEMPIQDLYKMPSVKQGDFAIYKEAIGLTTEEDKKRE